MAQVEKLEGIHTVSANPQLTRVAVLGASGKIGRIFCHYGARDFAEDLEIIPFFRGHSDDPRAVKWCPEDVDKPDCQADVVLALWGVVGADDKQLSANVSLAKAANALAQHVGASHVIHCSSVAVYAPSDGAVDEDWPTRPQNAYGQSKLEMEHAALAANDAGQLRSICLRIGNVAGADSLFAAGARDGHIVLDQFEPQIGPARSYIAPVDLTRVFAALIKSQPEDLPSVLNVAAPGATRMQDLAAEMDWAVSWRDAPDTARRLVEVSTARLSKVVRLPTDSASAEWIARDVKFGGWQR